MAAQLRQAGEKTPPEPTPIAPASPLLLVHDAAIADDVHWTCSVAKADPVSPEILRRQMEQTGLSKIEFAQIFGVSPGQVQDWLAGKRSIPSWVLPSVQLVDLLPPAERRQVLNTPHPRAAKTLANKALATKSPAKVHPFSRIEDL